MDGMLDHGDQLNASGVQKILDGVMRLEQRTQQAARQATLDASGGGAAASGAGSPPTPPPNPQSIQP